VTPPVTLRRQVRGLDASKLHFRYERSAPNTLYSGTFTGDMGTRPIGSRVRHGYARTGPARGGEGPAQWSSKRFCRSNTVRSGDGWPCARGAHGQALRKRIASRHAEGVEDATAGVALVQQRLTRSLTRRWRRAGRSARWCLCETTVTLFMRAPLAMQTARPPPPWRSIPYFDGPRSPSRSWRPLRWP
jgi:hypothetical protein